jgi:lipopolysaccharide biosynthesis regulator YciM
MSDPVSMGLLVTIALILIVVVALLFSGSSSKQKPKRGASEAMHLLLSGEREAAKRLLTDAVRRGEAPPEAYLRLGDLLRADGDASRALSLHQGLLARPTLDPELRRLCELSLADDLLALGRVPEAQQRLAHLERTMRDDGLLARLATALHRLGRADEAAEVLERRVRLGSETARTDAARYLAEMAREALRDGKLETAHDRARRALALDPKVVTSYLVEGDRLLQISRVEEAVKIWRQGLHACENAGRWLLPRLAEAAYRTGRMDALIEELEEERASRPKDVHLWRAVADLRLRRGDLESFFALVENPPHADAADLSFWAGWLRHLSALENPRHLKRLLRSLPDSSAPGRFRCATCGALDAEPRVACVKCGAWTPLQEADERASAGALAPPAREPAEAT